MPVLGSELSDRVTTLLMAAQRESAGKHWETEWRFKPELEVRLFRQ